MKQNLPHLRYEKRLWKKDYLVIGVDEVGRGAFAGPLVLGGVIFDKLKIKSQKLKVEKLGINDSKKLTPQKREELAKVLKKISYCAVAYINVDTINKVGIGRATSIGVRKVVKKLQKKLVGKRRIYLLIDAFYIKYIKGIGLANQKAIVHGDEISLSIAAASIIAKVKRDRYMKVLSFSSPEYKWDSNKGYGTKIHLSAIKQYGVSIYHRELWVRSLVNVR